MNPLLRYAAVGTAATAAHYGLMTLAVTQAHWPAWVASGCGATLGAQLAFWGNRRYTFGHTGRGWRAWVRFQLAAGAGTVLGMGLVAAGARAGLHYLAAQVLATGAVMLATFGVNRRWAFRPD